MSAADTGPCDGPSDTSDLDLNHPRVGRAGTSETYDS